MIKLKINRNLHLAFIISIMYTALVALIILFIAMFLPAKYSNELLILLPVIFVLVLHAASYFLTGKYIANKAPWYGKSGGPYKTAFFAIVAILIVIILTFLLIYYGIYGVV